MRKFVLAAVAATLLGITPSAIAGGGEKTYWLGEGEGGADVEFRIQNGKVIDKLGTYTGKVRCSGGSKFGLGRNWYDFRFDGGNDDAFKERDEFNLVDRRWFVSGHIGNSNASGRFRGRTTVDGESCDSGFIKWEAERVSKNKWDEFHGRP